MTTTDDEIPNELIVDPKPAPGDASSSGGVTMAPIVLTVLGAGFLAQYVSLTAAAAGLFAGVVFVIARRKPTLGRFILRVEEGDDDGDLVVLVTRERTKDSDIRIALSDLIDVTLDKEAQASGSRGSGATVDRVMLALRRRGDEAPILMPEARITPIEGQEWQAKVRVFLRKHGWVPLDERDEHVD